MSVTAEEDLELTVKCLRQCHLILESSRDKGLSVSATTKTKRLFENEKSNEAERWQPGGIARAFSKLGLVLEHPQKTSKERPFFETLVRTIESDSQAKGYEPSASSGERNRLSCHDEGYSVGGTTSHKSSLDSTQGGNKSGKTRFTNYIPPRKFSPPKQDPSLPEESRNNALYTESLDRRDQNPSRASQNIIRPPSKQSLFSIHQQDTTKSNSSSSSPSHNFVNRFQNKHDDNKDFDDKKNDGVSVEQGSDCNSNTSNNPFRTAHQQLVINDRAKGIKRTLPAGGTNVHVSGLRKTARVDAPSKTQNTDDSKATAEPISDNPEVEEIMQHPSMKNIDPKMVETVLNEVFDVGETDWNDIAGLQSVKNVIKEIIIWPMLRPDIFTGLRGPPKGILLFGPPGTGKTMIGRLIATQSKSAFFNISASALTSKWIGEGEKMVRTLFAVARVKQPAVIFIDEIDSILTQRSDTEHESSRRLKTEFLIQFDGCGTKSEDRLLIVGVTNRPQELDEAARRRLVKRIYIPLPDVYGRKQLVKNLLGKQTCTLEEEDYDQIAELTNGYSGADMATLCQEASYGPIRDVGVDIQNICADQVRPMQLKDFTAAIRHVKASVDPSDLVLYEDWDQKFGCHL